MVMDVKKPPSLVQIAMENQKPSTFSRNNYHNAKIYQKNNPIKTIFHKYRVKLFLN
jgi:hypothetical protein